MCSLLRRACIHIHEQSCCNSAAAWSVDLECGRANYCATCMVERTGAFSTFFILWTGTFQK
jgi:hypothetical protein